MSDLLPHTSVSHYRIVSKIGVGGMGEVYLAQDTKLDRKVALKILPADLAANQDRMRRFVQEAKAAAALNHPNIAHIYEIGEADGVNFIAMEFVDGETLRAWMHRPKSELKVLRLIEVPVPSLYSMRGCPQPREPRFPQQFEENDVRNGLYSVAKIRTQ